jgi:hypothetical protein
MRLPFRVSPLTLPARKTGVVILKSSPYASKAAVTAKLFIVEPGSNILSGFCATSTSPVSWSMAM